MPIPADLRRRRCMQAALSLLLLPAAARAVPAISTEGFTFAGETAVAGQTLALNGVGLRAVLWLKGYAAGLYLTSRARTPAQVLATAGAKRLEMRMLLDVDTKEFIKAFHTGIARNTPLAGQPALAERMVRFDDLLRAVGKVKKLDVIDLDWLPGKGLQLALNGQPRGDPIPGDDLYAALLLIFLGDKPVDTALKAGLLGRPQS